MIQMQAIRMMTLLAAITLPGCTLFGIRGSIEEPPYTLTGHVGLVEVRSYPARLAAETTIDGSEMEARYRGFQVLAGYIFGANRSSAKIAMTAPVAQSSENIAMTAPVGEAQAGIGRWTIRFFMPAKYTRDTLPVSTNPAVHIVSVPAETYAVLRFTGIPGPRSVAEEQVRLLRLLAGSSWRPEGTPVAWFYDPPWTIPFLRRNEVAVKVVAN